MNGLQVVLHTQDHNGRLAAAIDNKPFLFPDGPVHELSKLCPRHVCIDSVIHLGSYEFVNQSINQSINQCIDPLMID